MKIGKTLEYLPYPLIILALTFGVMFLLPDKKPQNKIVWRGHTWDTKPDSSFVHKSDTDGMQIYAYKYEKTCLGSERVDSVRYYFYKKKLLQIIVYIPTKESSKRGKQLGIYHEDIQKLSRLMKDVPKEDGYSRGHDECVKYHKDSIIKIYKNPYEDKLFQHNAWKKGWHDYDSFFVLKSKFDSLKLVYDKDSSFRSDKIIAYYRIQYGENREKPVLYWNGDGSDCWFENSDKEKDVTPYQSDFRLQINLLEGQIVYFNFKDGQRSRRDIEQIVDKQRAKADSVKNASKNAAKATEKARMKRELDACGGI